MGPAPGRSSSAAEVEELWSRASTCSLAFVEMDTSHSEKNKNRVSDAKRPRRAPCMLRNEKRLSSHPFRRAHREALFKRTHAFAHVMHWPARCRGRPVADGARAACGKVHLRTVPLSSSLTAPCHLLFSPLPHLSRACVPPWMVRRSRLLSPSILDCCCACVLWRPVSDLRDAHISLVAPAMTTTPDIFFVLASARCLRVQ